MTFKTLKNSYVAIFILLHFSLFCDNLLFYFELEIFLISLWAYKRTNSSEINVAIIQKSVH